MKTKVNNIFLFSHYRSIQTLQDKKHLHPWKFEKMLSFLVSLGLLFLVLMHFHCQNPMSYAWTFRNLKLICFLVFSWFFERCSREKAMDILKIALDRNYGNTLMRESTTHISSGSYVISKITRHKTYVF